MLVKIREENDDHFSFPLLLQMLRNSECCTVLTVPKLKKSRSHFDRFLPVFSATQPSAEEPWR